MSPDLLPPVKPRWADRVLIGLFAVLLALPLLDEWFHFDPTKPQSENRLLAERPARPTGLPAVRKYLAGWEDYFNDHFGFRNCFILWHNKLNWYVFKVKSTPSVIVGRDGWLFYGGDRMIDHYRGTLRFTERELASWQHLLEKRRDWLSARGIHYVFVVAPDKQSIYPEKLPRWLAQSVPPERQTKLDQLIAHLKAHSKMEIIDLRPALLAAKHLNPTYQMTDLHWNEYGAYVGYQVLMQELVRQQVPGMEPVPLADYIQTNRSSPKTNLAGNPPWIGGLAEMLGVKMTDTNLVFLVPGPALPACQAFIPEDKHIREPAYVKNLRLSTRAIVYQDSFARYWLPFLGNHFGETDQFWQYQLDAKEIERQKPLVVISEFFESKFNLADPDQLSKLEALP